MQTVVGVFDTVDEAERARASLVKAGFDESSVSVQSQSGMPGTNDAVGAESTRSKESDEGFMAGIGNFFSNLFGDEPEHAGHYAEAVRRGGLVVMVTVPDESRVEAARAALAAAGAVDIDKRAEGWRQGQGGYTGFDPAARPFAGQEIQAEHSRMQAQNGTVLPVVREEIEVGKREVDLGTVRVFSRIETQPVSEEVQLRETHAEIERQMVDRPATDADLKAFEGGSIEIHETTERPVVSKQARVVEEVRVGKQETTRSETVTDQVRHTVVDIEKSDARKPD